MNDESPKPKARQRGRARMRNVRRILLGLLLVAAILALVLALQPEPVVVDVAPVRLGPLVVAVQETGRTRVKDRYVVSAPTTGRVARQVLEAGDLVREGDTLAELAPALSPLLDERTRAESEARLDAALSALRQARAQMARAATSKERAEIDLERTRKLVASDSLPAQNLEDAQFAARLAAEELASAEFAAKVASEEVRVARAALRPSAAVQQDRHLDVLAPASGRVLRVHQESAGVVQAGAPLIEVGDPGALEAVVDLLTTDAVHVHPGTPALLLGWGGEGTLNGRVRKVEPSAFTRPSALGVDEQRVNVILSFTDPPEKWAALGDGYHVEARLVLWQSPQVLQVPAGAVFRRGSGWALFKVEGNRARLSPVEIDHRGETDVEIVSGAAVGETVIVHPGDRVKDDVRLRVR